MVSIEVRMEEGLLSKARQYADENNASLEALITEHLTVLADKAGGQLTVREEIYADYRPPEEVVEALRAEGLGDESKTL